MYQGNFPVMSSAALATHTAPPSIYVSVLGSVFDVTPGARHYGPSGSYHAFAGKDASKAYVTGGFHEWCGQPQILNMTQLRLCRLAAQATLQRTD